MNAQLLIREHKTRIQLNPHTLTGNLYPLDIVTEDDPVEDRSLPPAIKTYTNPVRISTRKKNMLNNKDQQTPVVSELLEWFMVSDNETQVDIRLEFDYEGMSFKVTNRREINKYGDLIGYEYQLKDLTENNSYV